MKDQINNYNKNDGNKYKEEGKYFIKHNFIPFSLLAQF